jgi:glutathione S-transferase
LEREERFLRLNPAGATPVLCENDMAVPARQCHSEYLDETRGLA